MTEVKPKYFLAGLSLQPATTASHEFSSTVKKTNSALNNVEELVKHAFHFPYEILSPRVRRTDMRQNNLRREFIEDRVCQAPGVADPCRHFVGQRIEQSQGALSGPMREHTPDVTESPSDPVDLLVQPSAFRHSSVDALCSKIYSFLFAPVQSCRMRGVLRRGTSNLLGNCID